MESKGNIRIEEVADINFDYPYLEVFYKESDKPFLDIGITAARELSFKFYASYVDLNLTINEIEIILFSAKEFLPKALKNRDDFLNWNQEK